MNREILCISCPRGCNLTVDENMNVSGNSCARGIDYALQELQDPRRVLTVVVKAQGSNHPISVKTDKPVPKGLLMDCAREIYNTTITLPISCGDVIVENILDTGCNVISTCDRG